MPPLITAESFGKEFHWGVAIAAAQNEGAAFEGGRGRSVWDHFSRKKGNIKGGADPFVASDFYHRYKTDIAITRQLGFNSFRFSIAWPRILPDGNGRLNKEGITFYHEVIDECLKNGLMPFVTLYHWDLPYALEKEGGWTNPSIIKWFSRFVKICAEHYADKVSNWIILNEPLSFTALGYMLGKHAPGRTGLQHFLPAVHHAAIAQAEGGRIIRSIVKGAYIGTSFSCSEIIPYSYREEDIRAAERIDIMLNRLFIEPLTGRGYPQYEGFSLLDKLEMTNRAWRYVNKMKFEFDFIGLQNYFPVVIKYNRFVPLIQASEVKATTRKVPHTDMGWEVNPDSFYRIIRKLSGYFPSTDIIITENGASYKDVIINGRIHDEERKQYFIRHIQSLWKLQKDNVRLKGYFVWTLTDNFEWSEGYHPKFGLVHVDRNSLKRTIKDSGYWWRDFLMVK